jgi:hypothetical protein
MLTYAAGALDTVLAQLSDFISPSHLHEQIDALWILFDTDENGLLTYEEMRLGLARLDTVSEHTSAYVSIRQHT